MARYAATEKEMTMEKFFYKITLGGETKIVSPDEAMNVADEMVRKAGGGVPSIDKCDEAGNLIAEPSETEVEEEQPVSVIAQSKVVPSQKAFSDWGKTIVDDDAKKRIEEQHARLKEAGITIDTKQQFFATGTRMARDGYKVQEERRKEFFQQQLLLDVIQELQNKVSNEIRRDFILSAKEIADFITVEDGKVYIKDHTLTENAIRGLMQRIASPASTYLLGLRERSLTGDADMLAEVLRYECLRYGDAVVKLRMREFPQDIYAAVSATYAPADAPIVMEQIVDKMPKDARGSYAYDPDTTAWVLRANVFTPTPIEEQCVAEPFEGFVSLTSKDNGSGRFRGSGGINLLRCLNASTYSAGESSVSRVHRGGRIMFDIQAMLNKSLKAVRTLCAAWGKAREEEVEVPTGLTLSEAIPGFWRYLLASQESQLVNVLPGRKEHHVKALTQEYFGQRRNEEKLVKADFAQAWTHYIQNQPLEVREEAEEVIGSFVVKKQNIRCEMKED